MELELSLLQRIGDGQFADVFAVGDGSRVCKLYRAAGSDKWREWAPRVHQEEVRAYELASQTPVTADLLAKCYGAVSVLRVTDAAGTDVSDRYLLDTGILLERLRGPEEKAFELDFKLYPDIEQRMDALWNAGVDATDASAFGLGTPGDLRFIDVTTRFGARIISEVM